jgi:hypothetical protein
MSPKFFRNDRAMCMFDPDTFKLYRHQAGCWVEGTDSEARERVRLRSIELIREQARQHLSPRRFSLWSCG